MAKESTRNAAERIAKKIIWDIFEEVKDYPTAKEAQVKLLEIFHGQVIFSAPVIVKIVQDGLDIGEIETNSPFCKWIDEKKEPKKKLSMQEIAEQHFGCTMWNLFINKFSDIENAEDAAKRIGQLSKGKVTSTALTVIKTIQRGIENSTVKESDFFVNWVPKKKEKVVKEKPIKVESPEKEIQKKKYPVIQVSYSCKCGHHSKNAVEVMETNIPLGLKGKRCTNCNKFGTTTGEFSYNGEQYIKEVQEVPMMNTTVSMEVFVDKKGNIITPL